MQCARCGSDSYTWLPFGTITGSTRSGECYRCLACGFVSVSRVHDPELEEALGPQHPSQPSGAFLRIARRIADGILTLLSVAFIAALEIIFRSLGGLISLSEYSAHQFRSFARRGVSGCKDAICRLIPERGKENHPSHN